MFVTEREINASGRMYNKIADGEGRKRKLLPNMVK